VLPDLSLLLALVIGLFSLQAPEGASVDLVKSVGGTAALTLVVAALCRMAADRAVRGVDESDASVVVSAGARLSFVPLLGWVSALTFFEWGRFVAATVPVTWLMAPYVVFFLPLGVMFASGWLALRRIERRLSPSAPTRWGAIRRGLRRNALTLLPLAVLLLVQDGIVLLARLDVPGIRRLVAWHAAFPDFEALVLVAVLAALTWFAPGIIRRVLRAEPLPPGELRSSVERLFASMGVGFRDVLLWKTNRRVVNAMVMGLSGRRRYVFLTDGLLSLLPPAEVLAVVAHEAGHARKRHLPHYFVVSLALMLLLRGANEVAVPLFGGPGDVVVMVLFLALFWFGLLGWLSRKFEREADAFAADHAGDLEPGAPPTVPTAGERPVPFGAAQMIGALARIHAHTGVGGRHHRHGSPPARIAFLVRYATDPAARREFARSTRALRLGLAGFFVLALGTTAARLPGGLVRGDAVLALLEGQDDAERAESLREKGSAAEAVPLEERAHARFRRAVALLAERPDDAALRRFAVVAAFNAADLDLHRLGRPEEARKGFAETLALAEGLPAAATAPYRFQAHVDLGRLALRDASDPKRALLEAKLHLRKARDVPESEHSGEYRRIRTRLLEAVVRAHDEDPAQAAEALRTLGQMASKTWDDRALRELSRDAAEELRLAPKR
jgi:Zn-dependent protease with chaperone function